MLTGDGSEQENASCSTARQVISHTQDAWMQTDLLEMTLDELVLFWSLDWMGSVGKAEK